MIYSNAKINKPMLLLLTFLWWIGTSSSTFAVAPKAEISSQGMVASRSKWASQVGADILAEGGNAVDAAVAVGFALAVTYPSAGNLGGGGFMVIYLKDGTVVTNDHREKAPLAADRDMYLDEDGNVVKGLSTKTHLAVGVPGTVAGLIDVLEKYGTKSLAQVIQPAIELAEKGIVLDRDLAGQFQRRQKDFEAYPASLAVFTNNGTVYKVGDRFVQKDLAKTLKRIKRHGRAGFYAGKTADLLVADMQANKGLITREDLRQYASVWRQPIKGTYRGHDVYSMPPPSSGGVLLVQMLNMLEGHDMASLGYGSAARAHLMIEAQRRAYADRAEYLGDPDFYPVPVAKLTSKSYAKERFADFDANKADVSSDIAPGEILIESPETTHASVMDAEGNAVSYTTTLNLSYGSKIVAAGTGVLLNNEMDDFSAKANTPNFYGLLGRKANEIAPSKRMLSSMTPTIVAKDGKALLVTGSPGGSTIITTTLQVVVNVIDHNMNLSDAVASPRVHHQWQPDRIVHEPFAFSPDTLTRLTQLGHKNLFPIPSFLGRGIGDANSVMLVPEGIAGMADPRNAGAAIGP